MKVIITGATGMVGKGVLLECLDHPDISKVLSIGRSELAINHPKLVQIIHKDFICLPFHFGKSIKISSTKKLFWSLQCI